MATIQWFPGHMFRAKNEIIERLKEIDLVIQVLDARLPASSTNPLLDKLSVDKVKLKILNKADLADSKITDLWLNYFNKQTATQAMVMQANGSNNNQSIIAICRQLVPNRQGMDKPLRILISGVPNVGKSTLINNLIGHKLTKTGNEAGITKMQQRIVLAKDIWLYDTPGMLWEKIIVPESGYRLAIAGSVGRNAYEDEAVVLPILEYLKCHYQQALLDRYQLEEENLQLFSASELLENIARQRKVLSTGGRINYQKVSELIIQDFRTGRLGNITLEQPEEWQQWLVEANLAEEARAKIKLERKKKKAK